MFIDFNTDEFEKRVEQLDSLLKSNKEKIEELLKKDVKTYESFVRPFTMLDELLEQFFTPISHLNSVKNSELTQKIYSESLPLLSLYSTDIGQDERLYEVFKDIKKSEYSALSDSQKRSLDLLIQDFELSGAGLSEEKKDRLKAINLRKSEISNDFSQNLLNATNAYELIIDNEEDVKGLPKSDIETAKIKINGKTVYKFTLQMPSYISYMTYGPNRALREELYRAYSTRAPQNAVIIDELLALRQEMAHILGFESYSAYSLATKMSPDVSSVLKFLRDLSTKAKSQAQHELFKLKDMAYEDGIKEIQSYDSGFYSEILKKKNYDLDEELYRQYFEKNSVINGLFDFLKNMFSLEFKKVEVNTWDEKAQAYDLYLNDTLRARLYLDLEARKDKRGGAWMHNWQSHCVDEHSKEHLASAFIVCNFPSSNDNTPSLLRHDDVVTLFHEMGHALHHMLSQISENSVSGVHGVEWDAVEFPSQFLENFAYEPQVLKMFASHIETSEVLSDKMIEKLVKAKNFQSAMQMMRQIEFSLFDFELHTKAHKGTQIQELLNKIRVSQEMLTPPSYSKFQNGFAHIFSGGYAAGYYSYKWAEVLSADAFFAFTDRGIFDKNITNSYLTNVLFTGGSRSMQDLFEKFLGREPDSSALLRLNGII